MQPLISYFRPENLPKVSEPEVPQASNPQSIMKKSLGGEEANELGFTVSYQKDEREVSRVLISRMLSFFELDMNKFNAAIFERLIQQLRSYDEDGIKDNREYSIFLLVLDIYYFKYEQTEGRFKI